jgi:uroporphyrin-III C-methyltransferase
MRVVVRLKGGDPSLFGRLEEELEALAAAGIACEVVPGVTAALAAAAHTQRPLTRRGRGRSVAFSTAMTAEGELRPRAMPTPRSSTWPAASSARCRAPAGRRLAGRHAGVRGLARRLRRPAGQRAPLDTLAAGHVLHAGRPTVVTVGVAAVGGGAARKTLPKRCNARPAEPPRRPKIRGLSPKMASGMPQGRCPACPSHSKINEPCS